MHEISCHRSTMQCSVSFRGPGIATGLVCVCVQSTMFEQNDLWPSCLGWVSSFLTTHQHIIGYSVTLKGRQCMRLAAWCSHASSHWHQLGEVRTSRSLVKVQGHMRTNVHFVGYGCTLWGNVYIQNRRMAVSNVLHTISRQFKMHSYWLVGVCEVPCAQMVNATLSEAF